MSWLSFGNFDRQVNRCNRPTVVLPLYVKLYAEIGQPDSANIGGIDRTAEFLTGSADWSGELGIRCVAFRTAVSMGKAQQGCKATTQAHLRF